LSSTHLFDNIVRVDPSPKVVTYECRSVATQLERLAKAYFASEDRALLEEAARVLRSTAEEFDQRNNSA
jgi:hypothetical protein